MEITGKLIRKLELMSGIGKTGNSWQKQEFVIETLDQYPRKICANLWGDKIDNLSSVNIGDTVVISFDIESREFNGKWYTDVKAWKIEKQSVASQQNTFPVGENISPLPVETGSFETFTDEGISDDLPF